MDDRWEVALRFATFPLADFTYIVRRDDRFNAAPDPVVRQLSQILISSDARSRQILAGEAIYHFGRGRPVRPLLGLGVGSRFERFAQSCGPAGCEQLLPILGSPAGRHTFRTSNLTFVAGLSGRIGERLLVRGGVRLHNFAGEETSTTEVFFATGYQFF